MNDFLKSLRANSKEKRYDRNNNRRYYNSNQYNGNPQYRGNDRNNGKNNHVNERLMFFQEETLPQINSMLETIAESQKRMADAEERRAAATENIAASLQYLLQKSIKTSESTVNEVALAYAEIQEDSQPEYSNMSSAIDREAVIGTIVSMRKKGATYAQIASHLDSQNIPTFSGKGAWHAQTIHRLCKVDN